MLFYEYYEYDHTLEFQLPDHFQDFYKGLFGIPASADTLRFCKVALTRSVWLFLMDSEFMHAYEHGIVILCGDGVKRRVFPRFFVYSADYPEKYVFYFTSIVC